MVKRKKKFIKEAIKTEGGLSRQLGIPEKENIPFTLLRAIVRTKIGKIVRNPTMTGKRRLKVTRLLKRRAVLGLTLKRITKKRFK